MQKQKNIARASVAKILKISKRFVNLAVTVMTILGALKIGNFNKIMILSSKFNILYDQHTDVIPFDKVVDDNVDATQTVKF